MRIWSILLIISDVKWFIHLSRSLNLNFNYLVSVTAGGPESRRAYVAKFYGRLRLIRSVLRASHFPCSKLIEIVILWVYYTIPFGCTVFFGTFRHHFSHFLTTVFGY